MLAAGPVLAYCAQMFGAAQRVVGREGSVSVVGGRIATVTAAGGPQGERGRRQPVVKNKIIVTMIITVFKMAFPSGCFLDNNYFQVSKMT